MSSVNIHLKGEQLGRAYFAAAAPKAAKAPAPPKEAKPAAAPAAAPAEEEDKMVLTNAEHGKVVTRFPPEASGFIHIGHAKAALVNSMLRTKYDGKMVFRFDDTNPDKEKHDFEVAIIEDLGKLGVKWDVGPTYSSDYFELLLEKAEDLIKRGLAYCDDTEKEEMRRCRGEGIPTKNRDNDVARNTEMWNEMKAGSAFGATCCLRAKISIDAENKALRDPVLYRVNLNPHTRTGRKYNLYPTYDFTCPIVDSVEGVTHALRTNEYHDRNDQYYWILDALSMRKPLIEDFSRLNMEYTVMSKRKLTALVNDKVVDGWDDPRFPTVRALLRRGVQVEALKEFVRVQGMSKAVNFMEWNKLWNFNAAQLDPVAPRFSAVSAAKKHVGTVLDFPGGLAPFQRALHKKLPENGMKTMYHSNRIYLDTEDIVLLKEGEEVTLMDWGNAFIRNIKTPTDGSDGTCDIVLNPTGDFKKTKYKLTWVPHNEKNVKLQLCEYDHLLTKRKPEPEESLDGLISAHTKFSAEAIGEEAMGCLKPGQTLQIERRGFYIVDTVPPPAPYQFALIYIPDGKEKQSHLLTMTQFRKSQQPAEDAAAKKAPATGKVDEMSLEERRAQKAAKKAAASGKPAAK